MRRIFGALPTIAAFALSALSADEGRIPIFQPTNITQPGHYIVTRDIFAPATVIVIRSNNVSLELNGKRLSNASVFGDPVILIDPGFRDVVIRNGHIVASSFGIMGGGGQTRVRVEHVIINAIDSGINITSFERAEIIACQIDAGGSGIVLNGTGTFRPFSRVIDNLVTAEVDGIRLLGAAGGEIRGNTIIGGRCCGSSIILSGGSGGTLVQGNTFHSADAYGIEVSSPGNLILENVVSDCDDHGIKVVSDGNRIDGNVVRSNFANAIEVDGNRNLIERNQLEGNGQCGIYFINAGSHAYRDNMLRGNTGGGVCGTTNTDAGGNIL